MRKEFAKELKKLMKKDKNIYLLLGGVGYSYFEPDNDRVINCEASEQAMVDLAVGLAITGKIPFVYAITPHLYRAFEGIRIYLDHYKVPVKLVGACRDKEYDRGGFTHWAHDAKDVFGIFKNINKEWWDECNIKNLLQHIAYNKKPEFISLKR
jgi:transketolase